MEQKKYLAVIAGPTAVGKTRIAIELAKHYQTVVVSADSRQFYREMNIGTAKPTKEQLSTVTHFFIGNKSVTELYGAGHFEKDAIKVLEEQFKKHQVIIMVGGSGLYIDAVLNGVDDFIEVPGEVREALNSEFDSKGLSWLQEEVKKADRPYFDSMDTQNPQRLIRALEVFKYTGISYSSFLNKKKSTRPFVPLKIMVNTDREELYSRINLRVDEMMTLGLLDEVKTLEAFKNLNALKTVGYKELYDHLEGKLSLKAAVEKIKQHTRNYAKRQITWFNNRDTFIEFERSELGAIIKYIDSVIAE